MMTSRRDFLIQGAAALTSTALLGARPLRLLADPLARPIGLQLYTVTEQLQKDFDGTLRKISAIGFKEVEMAGFFGKTPMEFKKSLDRAGLHCGSVHIFGSGGAAEAIEYAAGVEAKYVISSITLPQRSGKFDPKTFGAVLSSLTLDDYKSIAEQCNKLGELVRKSGLQFGYHNHNFEFKPLHGGIGYDELLRAADPQLVKFELDCGWMVAAGYDPASYLTRYPDRYRLLHIKDFKATAKPSFSVQSSERPASTELGRGHVNYKSIFAAAKNSGVEWYYIEQEPPYVEMAVMEAVKVNYEYLHHMS